VASAVGSVRQANLTNRLKESMRAPARRNVGSKSAYMAAARHFKWLAKLFASPTTAGATPRLTPRQMAASLKAFKKASPVELAEVSALLHLIVVEIDKIEPATEVDAGTNGSERD
jgi:hypothetical protein